MGRTGLFRYAVDLGDSCDAYTYDAVGNRLSSADVGDVIAHNERNELRVYGDLTFGYDANGNQTDRRDNGAVVQKFVYDAENRLVFVEAPSAGSGRAGGVSAKYEPSVRAAAEKKRG